MISETEGTKTICGSEWRKHVSMGFALCGTRFRITGSKFVYRFAPMMSFHADGRELRNTHLGVLPGGEVPDP
jgi:hypothetical protein